MLIELGDFSLRKPYVPSAKYNRNADLIEYVREDKPYIMRRVDEFLTIALEMDTRKPAGFRLKGFRKFFDHEIKVKHNMLDDHFFAVVSLIELAATKTGKKIFGDGDLARQAYRNAYNIAVHDRVVIAREVLAA